MNIARIHSRKIILAMSAVALVASGCADMTPTQRNSAIGAGVGAVAGGAIGGNAQGAVVGAGVGALGGYVWSKYMSDKKAAMDRATAGTGATVVQTQDNQLKLNIPSDISFDTGRSDIKPNLRPILDQFAAGLGNQPNTTVRIIGHTDSTGSDAINNPLSVARAQSTRDYLAARGIDPRRVSVEGRGKNEPIADNNTEAGRAMNRRVEIYLAETVASR